MAVKDIVKGICNLTRCKYDVYTKERTDELLNEVNTTLGTKANSSDVYVKGDFATITKALKMDSTGEIGSTGVNFPNGFTPDNSIVISTLHKVAPGVVDKRYSSGHILNTDGYIKSIVVYLGKKDGTDDSKIYIQANGDDSGFLGNTNVEVKITLMKIS